MPYIEPLTLNDLPRKERDNLRKLLYERDILGYAFSYSKLFALLSNYLASDECHEYLQDCILAFDTNQEDQAKSELNDQISAILLENGMTGVRSPDPFGRLMDCTIYTSTSPPRFNRNKAIELAPSMGVSTTAIMAILDSATSPGSAYAAVRVVAVKQKDKEE